MKCKGVGILIILEIFNSFYNKIITQGIHIEIYKNSQGILFIDIDVYVSNNRIIIESYRMYDTAPD